jgi:hypothetical protein
VVVHGFQGLGSETRRVGSRFADYRLPATLRTQDISRLMIGWIPPTEATIAAAEPFDPWRLRLERVRGKIDFYDRLERTSSQNLLDVLEVPQRQRTAGTYRRLCKIMTEFGWTAVRVRDLTRGGYREQVRGYCREARQGRTPRTESCTPGTAQCPNTERILP